jgi:hypothetical protein
MTDTLSGKLSTVHGFMLRQFQWYRTLEQYTYINVERCMFSIGAKFG